MVIRLLRIISIFIFFCSHDFLRVKGIIEVLKSLGIVKVYEPLDFFSNL